MVTVLEVLRTSGENITIEPHSVQLEIDCDNAVFVFSTAVIENSDRLTTQ